MEPFCVEAELSAPLACSPAGYFTASLDSLLMWAAAGKTGGLVSAPVWRRQLTGSPPDIPLARVSVGGREVWAGSVGFPVGPVRWFRFGWTKKWTGQRRWVPPRDPVAWRKKSSPWDPKDRSGPFRDRMDYLYCLAAGKVRFYGLGDAAAAEKLLRENVFALGHKRKRGFGLVRRWGVFPVSRDHSVWLRTPSGEVYPARPLPLAAAAEEPGAVWVTMAGSLDPPRWLREAREDLMFPPPFLWQEGLRDGPADDPEPNPFPAFGSSGPLAALVRLAPAEEGFVDPLAG